MGEILALLLVLGAIVGILIFMVRPNSGGALWSRLSDGDSGGKPRRQGATAVIVLVALQVAQLTYSGALSFAEMGRVGLDAAFIIAVGALLILGSTMALGRRVLTFVGALLGIANLGIQHGPGAALSVAVILLLLVTLAGLVGRLVGSR